MSVQYVFPDILVSLGGLVTHNELCARWVPWIFECHG